VAQTEVEAPEAAAVETRPAATVRSDGPKSQRTVVIRPASRWPRLDIGELWHYRELLLTLVWRDIKVRYKQTVIGVAWALIVPVFTIVVYTLIYGKFAKFPAGTTKYPVLVTAGVVPMQYFTACLTGSSASIVGGGALVSKVYFPRILLPLAAILVPAVDLLLAFGVMLVVMGWYGFWPTGPEAVLAPVFMALALVTALGLGLSFSALNVRYRDVQYVIPVFLPLLPLLSGVVYAVNRIPEKWQWILSVNPMTTAITGWRWALLGAAPPDPAKAAVGVGVALVLFTVGLAIFRRSEPKFADLI
jgi:lipopolysaccharide transport system permease protein